MDTPSIPQPVIAFGLIGSAAIYGSGRDTDYCVLVSDVDDWLCTAKDNGWKLDGKYPGNDFTSVRKDDINLIVTKHAWMFEAYRIATEVMCKLTHIAPQSDKVKRVMMYELIKEWSRPHDDTFC